jgi:hypothetical protein
VLRELHFSASRRSRVPINAPSGVWHHGFVNRAFPWALAAVLALVVSSFAAAGCGGSASAERAPSTTTTASEPVCPPALARGWQKLADEVKAPVYCPSWLPDPLIGRIGGQWEGVHSVTKEGSYLIAFIWFERGAGEVHVNLRGYPGQTKVPTCNGQPCFSGARGTREVAGKTVTVYTVNRGADTWHVLYAWKENGTLYAVSQHVVPELGLSYTQVVKYLDRIMAGLVKIEPQQS